MAGPTLRHQSPARPEARADLEHKFAAQKRNWTIRLTYSPNPSDLTEPPDAAYKTAMSREARRGRNSEPK